MTKPMEVTVTLDADVAERLPLGRSDRRAAELGGMLPELDKFVNDAIREYAPDREDYRKQFFFAGAQLGYPGYAEVYEREFGE